MTQPNLRRKHHRSNRPQVGPAGAARCAARDRAVRRSASARQRSAARRVPRLEAEPAHRPLVRRQPRAPGRRAEHERAAADPHARGRVVHRRRAAAFDVDDKYAFDIDEPVELDADLSRPPTPRRSSWAGTRAAAPAPASRRAHGQAREGLPFARVKVDARPRAPRRPGHAGRRHRDRPAAAACAVRHRGRRAAAKPWRPPPSASVKLTIKDAKTGMPVPARVGLYDATGRAPLASDKALMLQRFADDLRMLAVNERTFWPSENRQAFYVDGHYTARCRPAPTSSSSRAAPSIARTTARSKSKTDQTTASPWRSSATPTCRPRAGTRAMRTST